METKWTRILVFGDSREDYRQTDDGAWWVLNPQRGWVEIPATSRALRAAIAKADVRNG